MELWEEMKPQVYDSNYSPSLDSTIQYFGGSLNSPEMNLEHLPITCKEQGTGYSGVSVIDLITFGVSGFDYMLGGSGGKCC